MSGLMDRVKAMCELDVDTARAMDLSSSDYSDQVILIGLHKARIHMADIFEEITESMVAESKEWLLSNGATTAISSAH